MKSKEFKGHFLNENPITKPIEDIFNFKYYASKIQMMIQQNANNSEPITFGILGKWGEGKTSFLNLIKNRIEHFEKKHGDNEFLTYEFNPWRYSTQDEMLFDFFDGISKRFYLNDTNEFQEIALWLSRYGKYLKAIKIASTIGNVTNELFDVNQVFKALGEDLKQKELTIDVLKEKVNSVLKKSKFKIIVFIDDLDRLDKDEIYTILKLIKLNANFENFVFIVSLDADHVSKSISQRFGGNQNDGNLFLQKIINIPIQLPRIEKEDLQYFFEINLKSVIDNFYFLDDEKKINLLQSIRNEFNEESYSSPREIVRILNSFYISGMTLEEEVNLKDLFWIEWLKVVNDILYNKIKNYDYKTKIGAVWINQSETINFNDDYIDKQKPNGTRKKLIAEHPNLEKFLDRIFPVERNFVWSDENKIRINFTEQFETYFSYHTERKVSNVKILKIQELIKLNKSEELKVLIYDLFNEKTIEYKVLYKIEELIKTIKKENGRDFWFGFVIENLIQYFDSSKDMFSIDSRTRIIELISFILNKEDVNDNEEIIKTLSEKLNINQLCYFTRKFDDKNPNKLYLEELISIKAKKEYFDNINANPFYFVPENMPNKMIMHCWKKINSTEFDEYIKRNSSNIESIKLLIRNFPSFWNNSFFGSINYKEFDYMETLIDVNMLYDKICELNVDLVIKIDENYNIPSEHDKCTIDQNLEQFIYIYKLRKKNLPVVI